MWSLRPASVCLRHAAGRQERERTFSWYELHLIAAAFWPFAPAHDDYRRLAAKASARAKRQREVNQVFSDLRKELD